MESVSQIKQFSMHNTTEDEKSRFKLARLWSIINNSCHITEKSNSYKLILNYLLKDNLNINCKVTINLEPNKGSATHLRNCTVLHFLYYKIHKIDLFTTFLDRGADFTIKNDNGQTVLHLISAKYRNSLKNKHKISFMKAVLSAHVKFQNFNNPCDDNGFSHLHAACMVNQIEAVELFLNNEVSIKQAVNFDAPRFTGYTPLHFAVKFCNFEVAEILVKRKANVNTRNAEGKSPLDLLIENKSISNKEKMTKLLLTGRAISSVGLSKLQVACRLQNVKVAQWFLDQGVDIDYVVPINSPIYPGYTALHFAANDNIEAAKRLLKHGAKMDILNSEGNTPLDIIINKYSLQTLCEILSCNDNVKDICLSDGTNRLLDLIPVMRITRYFERVLLHKIKDITAIIPNNSVLWPGYSILHLAVTIAKKAPFYDKEIIKLCLNRGLSVNVQDIRLKTPIHLAFYQDKNGLVKLLFEHLNRDEIVDFVDKDNLSYLHVASVVEDESLVEKLLKNSDPNIAYKGQTTTLLVTGSTPLHIATAKKSWKIVDMLLKHSANFHATDVNNMTPIHWLLHNPKDTTNYHRLSDILFKSLLTKPEDRVVDGVGLGYLHVACYLGNFSVVKKLLDLGSNINQKIELDKYSPNFVISSPLLSIEPFLNYTPLQMATKSMKFNKKILDLLIRSGADVFVKGSKYSPCIPIENKTVLHCFMLILWDQDDFQKRIEERLGITKLHIACFMKINEAIKSVLNDKNDVNAQVHADSVIFAGCTPLHLLMTIKSEREPHKFIDAQNTMSDMLSLFLESGADVTIANTVKDTPIHVFYKYQKYFGDGDRCIDLLLNAQQNFNVNPADLEGLSHFHLSCLWHKVKVVEKFLQHGSVDINQPMDYFSINYPGYTPLHLALSSQTGYNNDSWENLSQTIELLLKCGSNAAAKDVHGDTPLHKSIALSSHKMNVLQKLVRYGGDINSENIKGETPIEVWLENNRLFNVNQLSYIGICQFFNYKINTWNSCTGEGRFGKVFLLNRKFLSENSEFKELSTLPYLKTIDDQGRNIIHNLVAHFRDRLPTENIKDYIYAIETFIKQGIDIDDHDKLGQTALHYAARMGNEIGIEALLSFGADINIVDNNGKSALSCAMRDKMTVLQLHLKKLQYLRLEVSKLNKSFLKTIKLAAVVQAYQFQTVDSNHLTQKFYCEIEMTKTLTAESDSLSLFDFLSDTGVVASYLHMPKIKRDLVTAFSKSIDFNKFNEITGIIKLQFNKMKRRLKLIDSALTSLRILLGFSVPDLCEQISRFLSNSDLNNLIKSTTLKTKKRKLSELEN